MKKSVILFCLALLLLSPFACHLSALSAQETLAEHVQIGDLYYNLNTQDYTAADTWKDFGTIAAIPAEGIDQITNDKSQMTNKIIRNGELIIESLNS